MPKILFVEDEQSLQKTFGDLLRKEGYEVISALDGEAGLRLAKSEKPDLVLLDLILPQKDGFEVLKDLKRDDQTKDIPVLILTNLESPSDVEKAINLGAATFLVKTNYRLEEIMEKIKKNVQ